MVRCRSSLAVPGEESLLTWTVELKSIKTGLTSIHSNVAHPHLASRLFGGESAHAQQFQILPGHNCTLEKQRLVIGK